MFVKRSKYNQLQQCAFQFKEGEITEKERVKELKKEIERFENVFSNAEKDGLYYKIPCKFGTTIYKRGIYGCVEANKYGMWALRLELGKDFWLNYDEAKQAVEAVRNKK